MYPGNIYFSHNTCCKRAMLLRMLEKMDLHYVSIFFLFFVFIIVYFFYFVTSRPENVAIGSRN